MKLTRKKLSWKERLEQKLLLDMDWLKNKLMPVSRHYAARNELSSKNPITVREAIRLGFDPTNKNLANSLSCQIFYIREQAINTIYGPLFGHYLWQDCITQGSMQETVISLKWREEEMFRKYYAAMKTIKRRQIIRKFYGY